MQSEELLLMIENCPVGAETLVARVVHLLTERRKKKINFITLNQTIIFFFRFTNTRIS